MTFRFGLLSVSGLVGRLDQLIDATVWRAAFCRTATRSLCSRSDVLYVSNSSFSELYSARAALISVSSPLSESSRESIDLVSLSLAVNSLLVESSSCARAIARAFDSAASSFLRAAAREACMFHTSRDSAPGATCDSMIRSSSSSRAVRRTTLGSLRTIMST